MNIRNLTEPGYPLFPTIPWPGPYLLARSLFLVLAGSLAMTQVQAGQIQAQSETSLGAAEMPDSFPLPAHPPRPALPSWAPVHIELGVLESTEIKTMAGLD